MRVEGPPEPRPRLYAREKRQCEAGLPQRLTSESNERRLRDVQLAVIQANHAAAMHLSCSTFGPDTVEACR